MVGRLAPERDPDVTSPFEVRDPAGVLRELRRMVDRGAEVVLVDDRGGAVTAHPIRLAPTALHLALHPEHVDTPVLSAPSLTLVSLVDEVKIQGELPGPFVADRAGVLVLDLPRTVVRLQRRGGYRVRIPDTEPAFLAAGEARYPVLDLSVRGIGLDPIGPLPMLGERWPRCRLRIGLQVLPVDLHVRYVDRDRIGCAFDPLPRNIEQELGRRVIDLERVWMRAR